MENTISNLERCRVIRDPKELNAEGCRYFMEADNIQPTFVSSTMLRWLTHENNGIKYYTNEQEEAVKRIIAAQRREDMAYIIYRHRENIKRLLKHQENKISWKKESLQ